MTSPFEDYRNEDSVGAAIRQAGLKRSELFVTTKWSGLTSIRDAIDFSLAQVGPLTTLAAYADLFPQLDLKQVDLYLIHNSDIPKHLEKDWREFERIKEEGLSKWVYHRHIAHSL